MTKADKVTQVRVGFFMLLGIALICSMVVYFGRFGDGLKEFYQVRVEYPNASGLFVGADVLLAGAKIGSVEEGPYVLKSMVGVYVVLKLYEDVRIPEGSAFTIGSSGLLGDSYVSITMPSDLDVENFRPILPDTVVQGQRETGLADLAAGGAGLLETVETAVKEINTVVTRINEEVLNPTSVEAIDATLKNLETTSAEFAKASEGFEKVLADASSTMEDVSASVERVTVTVEETVAQSQETVEAAKDSAEAFTRTMDELRAVIADARSGKGPLGTLLTDKTVSDNLRALVYNIRRYGILFYKDRAIQDRLKYEEGLEGEEE